MAPANPAKRGVLLKKAVRIAIAVYLGLALCVYFFPNGLIFFPERYPAGGDWTPPAGASDAYFTASDGVRLHGWWRETDPAAPTLLVFHGNAGNIAGRKGLIDDLAALGANVLLFDYRGFGRSEGTPFEAGVQRDADAAWRYLVEERRVRPDRIVLYGQSLGGVFACRLAETRESGGLILEAPFSSARDMASVILPWLPLGWALGVEMDNVKRIQNVRVPVLVVCGDKDSVIPVRQSRKVFEAAREPKRFVCIEGGGHNDLWEVGREAYREAIGGFLREVR